jgi:hypothetical protein
MAHRSHKKHIKHMHQHEPATPKAKSPAAKADVASQRISNTSKVSAAGKPVAKKAPAKKRGIVRRVAGSVASRVEKKVSAVERKVTAKPRRIIKRVKSMLGVED